MAFDQTTRNRLQRFVNDARKALEEEFTRQLQNDFGMDPGSGAVTPLENLRHLNDAQRESARILRDTLAHYCASQEVDAQMGLDRIVREQAFTVLNRLAALRMAEARGLLTESVGNGYQARGFQLYARLASTGLGETGDAYRAYLFSVFDELAQDLPGLFDRFSPQGRLFPRDAALLLVLALINDADIELLWGEDETIGWIYQYFNSKEERKAMREASQAPRNSRELAVRNQFFTPRYVVEFLVDNTLGRLWFDATGGQTGLRERCQYLLVKPDEAPGSVTKLRDPRTLKLLDPACGSMHFGLYAFDLFAEIYREAWDCEQQHGPGSLDVSTQPQAGFKPLSQSYADQEAYLRDMPRLIVEHNIYGVDIDPRAAQIASLALWLRAQRAWHDSGVKAKDRPLIGRGHVVAAIAPPAEKELRQQFAATLDHLDAELFEKTLQLLKGLPELGVLLQVERELPHLIRQVFGEHGPMFREVDMVQWQKAETRLRAALTEYAHAAKSTYQGRLFAQDALQGLRLIDLVREKFDVAVMNPPFGELPRGAKDYLSDTYVNSRNDLLSIFVDRGLDLLRHGGRLGAITSRTCFFAVSFANWRKQVVLGNSAVEVIADLGQGVMDDAMVEAAAYVLERGAVSPTISVIRAIADNDRQQAIEACVASYRLGAAEPRLFNAESKTFSLLPDAPFVYWANAETLRRLAAWPSFEPSAAQVRKGLRTGDNFRFVRALWEIPSGGLTTGISASDSTEDRTQSKWVPLVLSGSSQPWFSPILVALNWKNNGRELRQYVTKYGSPSRLIQAEDFYFRPGMSWTRRAARFVPYAIPAGCIPTGSRPMAFPNQGLSFQALGISASRVASAFLRFYGEKFEFPNFLEGKVKLFPWPNISKPFASDLERLVRAESEHRRTSYQGHEPFLEFIRPFGISKEREDSEVRIDWNSLLGIELESLAEESFGLNGGEAAELYRDLDEALAVRSSNVQTESGDEEDADDDSAELILDTSERSSCEANISYALGCAFGRWDIRFATGEKKAPQLSDPFASLPQCPPGQLQNSEGRTITKEEVERLIEEGQWSYPITIPWEGLLVDDQGHSSDIEWQVRQVLQVVWHGNADAPQWEIIENEACMHLGVRSLRDYFRKPSGFFTDHLKRYSKSRRKAPIYWPLSTRSGNYTVWVYYHCLSSQTLYTAINDFVEPKLKQVGEVSAVLRNKGSARTRAEEKQFEDVLGFELGSCPGTWCKKRSGSHGLRFGWSIGQAATAGRLTLGLSPTTARVSRVM
uniref:BREX-1 system adenine-specific DNA-methyltransferase PglX n=1 Tax=Accumulibacter sp. TaxID=2053492 RepID=UPI0035B2F397